MPEKKKRRPRGRTMEREKRPMGQMSLFSSLIQNQKKKLDSASTAASASTSVSVLSVQGSESGSGSGSEGLDCEVYLWMEETGVLM
jgi:hypothetical protein